MVRLERRNAGMFLVLLMFFGLSTAVHAIPKLQSWTTDKGARVVFVRAEGLPMLDVRVVFDAGSARDGDKPGLASFVNSMLLEGAGEWDADEIAERTENLGVQIGSGSLRDMAWVSVRTLTEEEPLRVARETLSTVIARPRFEAEAVERVRRQILVGLRKALQEPGTVANRRFYKTLYGDHPYAHPMLGEEDSVKAVTPEHMRALHDRYYVAANAVIAMVGDLDRASAERLADEIVADLPRGRHAEPIPVAPTVEAVEVREDFPVSQSHILIGQRGMARHDPDYFPLYVGNHALGGGGLVSILSEEVRHKRGLSYSVYSYFSPMRAQGPFMMVAQTKNAQADQALDVMRDTLRRFVEEGPTQEELDESKANIVNGFPLKVASNASIIEYIAMIGFYDLPLDWLETLTDKVEAVTLDRVRDAFSRRVDPQQLVVTIVGGTD